MALLRLFSSCDKQGVLLSSGVWTFHCGGFSRCSSWPPEYRLSSCGTGFGYSKCGIFSDQGLNPWLLHWQADSLLLSHQRSPPNNVIYAFVYSCNAEVKWACGHTPARCWPNSSFWAPRKITLPRIPCSQGEPYNWDLVTRMWVEVTYASSRSSPKTPHRILILLFPSPADWDFFLSFFFFFFFEVLSAGRATGRKIPNNQGKIAHFPLNPLIHHHMSVTHIVVHAVNKI